MAQVRSPVRVQPAARIVPGPSNAAIQSKLSAVAQQRAAQQTAARQLQAAQASRAQARQPVSAPVPAPTQQSQIPINQPLGQLPGLGQPPAQLIQPPQQLVGGSLQAQPGPAPVMDMSQLLPQQLVGGSMQAQPGPMPVSVMDQSLMPPQQLLGGNLQAQPPSMIPQPIDPQQLYNQYATALFGQPPTPMFGGYQAGQTVPAMTAMPTAGIQSSGWSGTGITG